MDEQTTAFLRNYGLILILAGAGLVFLAFGLSQMIGTESPVVITDSVLPAKDTSNVLIDVSGAVKKPGVYSLPESSRISDAIERAGGISEGADITYIAKVINKAKILQDGEKVFIPLVEDQLSTDTGDLNKSETININTASSGELDTLPGIGEVTAGKIISNRPYSSLEELVSKKSVSKSVFEKIKDQISLH